MGSGHHEWVAFINYDKDTAIKYGEEHAPDISYDFFVECWKTNGKKVKELFFEKEDGEFVLVYTEPFE